MGALRPSQSDTGQSDIKLTLIDSSLIYTMKWNNPWINNTKKKRD